MSAVVELALELLDWTALGEGDGARLTSVVVDVDGAAVSGGSSEDMLV